MGVRERSSCSFSRCRSLMVFTGSGASAGSSAAGSSIAGASATGSASAESASVFSACFSAVSSASASTSASAAASPSTNSASAVSSAASSVFSALVTFSTLAVFSTVSVLATFSTLAISSTFAVFSTAGSTSATGSAAFFSAASNRLSRVEATSVSDATGAATFGAGACLALALRRLVRPAAIASSRGTSGAFSFFGRPGRRRSVPCWASELSRTFLRRVSRVSAEAFFSSARAFSASKTPSSTFFSSDINLLSLHPAPHRKDFNSAHTAQSLVAATAAQASPYGARSSALQSSTISFSASAVGGERAERRARRDGHSHLALEHGTLTPFLGALPVFGFLRRGGRPARCDSYAPRLIAGALRVLSLDALVGIFMRVRGAQDTVFHYTR